MSDDSTLVKLADFTISSQHEKFGTLLYLEYINKIFDFLIKTETWLVCFVKYNLTKIVIEI